MIVCFKINLVLLSQKFLSTAGGGLFLSKQVFANREAVECPLVNKICNINRNNMVEGCFSCRFFPFYIFISWSFKIPKSIY